MFDGAVLTEVRPSSVGWLVLAVGDDRQHGGNDGYDDDPAVHYSWDSTVHNHSRLRKGDPIVLWDKAQLIGASVIQDITVQAGIKSLRKCPKCGRAGIKARKDLSPKYKCYKCKAKFEKAAEQRVKLTTYRSRHDLGWVDLSGCLSGEQLRALCEQPRSQLSLRQLRWADFRVAVQSAPTGQILTVLDSAAAQIAGGHKGSSVRVRIGQSAFRTLLLQRQGSNCAFTGAAPAAALEACHLYSYANVGEHHEHGGLLIRRDLHRLFDLGYICVNPETWQVDVGPATSVYPEYARLSGQPLKAELAAGHRRWLRQHWSEHRVAIPPSRD
jgi:ribosomal protein L37AE/L43A